MDVYISLARTFSKVALCLARTIEQTDTDWPTNLAKVQDFVVSLIMRQQMPRLIANSGIALKESVGL